MFASRRHRLQNCAHVSNRSQDALCCEPFRYSFLGISGVKSASNCNTTEINRLQVSARRLDPAHGCTKEQRGPAWAQHLQRNTSQGLLLSTGQGIVPTQAEKFDSERMYLLQQLAPCVTLLTIFLPQKDGSNVGLTDVPFGQKSRRN
jgi:hypothetical protein